MTIPLENQLTTILTPIFGNEIYPLLHPDPDGLQGSVSDKYATYSIVGGQSFNKLEGDDDLSRDRVCISIFSIDYSELKTDQRAVESAMKAANLLASQCVDTHTDQFEVAGALANVSVSVPIEDFEHDTRRYSSVQDFYVWSRS